MDRKTEAKLHQALGTMIQAVNGGENPTQALVKVASSLGLNDAMTRLLGQSYNSSRSIAHHQTYDGQDRCRPFSLANPDEAIDTVFNTNTKTAGERFTLSQLRRNAHLTEPGARVNFFDRALKQAATHDTEVTTEKTASVAEPTEPTAAERYVQRMEKQAAVRQAMRESMTADAFMHESLAAAALAVKMNLREMPFELLEQGLACRYGQEPGTKLAGVLFEAINGKGLRQKRATSFERSVFDYHLNPFSTIDRFVLSAMAASEATSKLAAAQEDAEPVPFAQPSSHEAVGMLPWTRAKVASAPWAATKAVTDVVPAAGNSQAEADREFESALDSASGSAAHTQARNIRVQAMLKELMASDPVISTYDPEEVTDRYNEIVSVAPHMADKMIAIRGILRRSLQQGNVDPFEVGQYLSMNKAQQEQGQADNSLLQAAASTSDVLRKGNLSYQRAKDKADEAYRKAMLDKSTNTTSSAKPPTTPPNSPSKPTKPGSQPPPLPTNQSTSQSTSASPTTSNSSIPAVLGLPQSSQPASQRSTNTDDEPIDVAWVRADEHPAEPAPEVFTSPVPRNVRRPGMPE